MNTEIPEAILEIARNLRAQDNRMTSHPIYMVQEYRGPADGWWTIQPFFTEVEAKAFTNDPSNRRNNGKMRVYVESGYRNEEWQLIRNWLIGLGADDSGHVGADGIWKPGE